MTTINLGDRAAVAAARGSVLPVRIRPRRGVITAPKQYSGVFAAARPTARATAIAARQHVTLHNYMTGVDVFDGNVSGSPPAWDPV